MPIKPRTSSRIKTHGPSKPTNRSPKDNSKRSFENKSSSKFSKDTNFIKQSKYSSDKKFRENATSGRIPKIIKSNDKDSQLGYPDKRVSRGPKLKERHQRQGEKSLEPKKRDNGQMRINQYIAHNLGLSRREADKLVARGMAELDGEIATVGQQVEDGDEVKVFYKDQWKSLNTKTDDKAKTLLFFKPIFAVTTRSDPQKRKTVYDFLPKVYHDLKPAGRLDYMSEGLLVFSDDGDLIHSLTHPSQSSEKIYLVGLKDKLDKEDIKQGGSGKMKVEDYVLKPVQIELAPKHVLTSYAYLKLERHLHWYTFVLGEGRNNQIRNMCQMWGQSVTRLIRIKQGKYELSEQVYNKKYLSV